MTFYEILAYVLDFAVLSSSVHLPRAIEEKKGRMKDNRAILDKEAHARLLYL